MLNHECGNINCTQFYNYISEIYSDFFPLVHVSRKCCKDKRWATRGILTSIRRKNKLYCISIEKPSDSNSIKYKEYRRILHSCLKAAEEIYYQQNSGPDNISPKLIRSCNGVLTKPLALSYNLCISSSTFSDDFKKANVIPLHKQLEKILVDKHRPISLLNRFSKLFERLVHKQVIAFLQKHALLYQYQFGFRDNHSTTLALETIDGININKGDITNGTYLDLKKAFDTVNHPILFEKVEHYGIRGMALAFFWSYLK